MGSDPMETMTVSQKSAWAGATTDVLNHGVSSQAANAYDSHWTFDFHEESRPGRGHYMDAIFCDGEHFAQITMDVYGYPSVSVATLDWIHSSSDEECGCEPCTKGREDDAE